MINITNLDVNLNSAYDLATSLLGKDRTCDLLVKREHAYH